jgi:magnesium transporter
VSAAAAAAAPAHAAGPAGAPAPACRPVRSVYRAPDGTVRTDLAPAELAELVAPGGACAPAGPDRPPAGALWVDLDAADPARVPLLREVFRVHPLAVEDTGNPQSRVKCEEYDGYLFVIVRACASARRPRTRTTSRPSTCARSSARATW